MGEVVDAQEAKRLQVLAELDWLIAEGDLSLKGLTRVASAVCGTPIGVVSLLDLDRQYFVGKTGLEPNSTPREYAFCNYVVQGEEDIFEVVDATADPRFSKNPLVTAYPNIRHYAGTPLMTAEGVAVGALCVIDNVPGALDDSQRQVLTDLGRHAAFLLQQIRTMRRLRIEQEAQHQLNQERQSMMMKLAHDIRVPLTSIVGITDHLGNEGSIADISEELESLGDVAHHLNHLLNDLLFISRSREAGFRVAEGRMRVDVLMLRLRRLFRRRCTELGIEFRSVIREVVPLTALGDIQRLTQVLVNLVENAIRHTVDGVITVEVDFRPGELRFLVMDTGAGISEERVSQLFEPYQRPTGEQSPGAGLGLSIVKELVGLMGGSLQVESIVGEGTKFIVLVPSLEADTPVRSHPDDEPLSGLTVAIADDNFTNRRVAKRLLQRKGATVVEFEDGIQLLEHLRTAPVDVVVLDHFMPGLSGPDTARRVHMVQRPAPIVVGWIGADDSDGQQRFVRSGVETFWPKPIQADTLDSLTTELREQIETR